jgi:hypothetical protein
LALRTISGIKNLCSIHYLSLAGAVELTTDENGKLKKASPACFFVNLLYAGVEKRMNFLIFARS